MRRNLNTSSAFLGSSFSEISIVTEFKSRFKSASKFGEFSRHLLTIALVRAHISYRISNHSGF